MFGEQTAHHFRDRFALGLTTSAVDAYLERLILTSTGSNYTRLYDTFQYYRSVCCFKSGTPSLTGRIIAVKGCCRLLPKCSDTTTWARHEKHYLVCKDCYWLYLPSALIRGHYAGWPLNLLQSLAKMQINIALTCMGRYPHLFLANAPT